MDRIQRSLRYLTIGIIGLLVLAAVVLLGVYVLPKLYTHTFLPASTEFKLKARDWEKIEFQTTPSLDSHRQTTTLIGANFTGAGVIHGISQNLFTSISGGTPAGFTGSTTLVIEEVEATIFELPDAKAFIDYDPDKDHYFLTFDSINRDYRPPFSDRNVLNDFIVYRSPKPERVELHSAQSPVSEVPRVHVLADAPTYYSWNIRRDCKISIKRGFDTLAMQQNELVLSEDCPSERNLPLPYLENVDSKGKLEYVAFDTPEVQSSLLVVPFSFSLKVDGWGEIRDTSSDYLLLLRHPENIVRLEIYPADDQFFFLSHVPSQGEIIYEADRLFAIEPTTSEIDIIAPSGKVTVGTKAVPTDELSSVHAIFDGWPTFAWSNTAITQEDGTDRIMQFLSGEGFVTSVEVNGEQVVLSRWENLPEEIQGALVTGLIGLAGWLLLQLGKQLWRRLASPSAKSQPLASSNKHATKPPVQDPSDIPPISNHDKQYRPPATISNQETIKKHQRGQYTLAGALLALAIGLLIHYWTKVLQKSQTKISD